MNDLEAIFHPAIHGYGLSILSIDETHLAFQRLTRHSRNLVKQRSRTQLQVRAMMNQPMLGCCPFAETPISSRAPLCWSLRKKSAKPLTSPGTRLTVEASSIGRVSTAKRQRDSRYSYVRPRSEFFNSPLGSHGNWLYFLWSQRIDLLFD